SSTYLTLPGSIETIKSFKNSFAFSMRNRVCRSGHDDLIHIGKFFSRDVYCFLPIVILNRIVKKVTDDLLNALNVYRHIGTLNFLYERDILLLQKPVKHIHTLIAF